MEINERLCRENEKLKKTNARLQKMHERMADDIREKETCNSRSIYMTAWAGAFLSIQDIMNSGEERKS